MGVFRSGDPARDFDLWQMEQQEWEDKLPRCECCGEPIDDYVWEIDEQILCEDCARKKYRRDAEDYMRGDGA